LDGAPGDACGRCGTLACEGDGLVCDDPGTNVCGECGPPTLNACGGCTTLTETPGASCGDCGTVACDGENATLCDDTGFNACGGCEALEGAPGDACGRCGTLTCDAGGLVCDDPGTNVCGECGPPTLNACGGCTTLTETLGSACGECGTVACDGENATICDDPGLNQCGACGPPVLNACGGCTTLTDEPGDACGECGQFVCSGTDAVSCNEPTACDVGPYIAWDMQANGEPAHIFIDVADGSRRRQLTALFGFNQLSALTATSPTWSPDGKKLAFVAFGFTGDPFLYTYDLELDEYVSHAIDLFAYEALAWHPTDPDVLAVQGRTSSTAQNAIYLYRFSTGLSTAVGTTAAPDTFPRWDASGQLYYLDTPSRVAVVSGALGGSPSSVVVSLPRETKGRFAVSPDGAFVVYGVNIASGDELVRVALDTLDVTVLRTNEGEGDPFISRDGLLWVFVSGESGNGELYTSGPDAASATALTSGASVPSRPQISPVDASTLVIP
jgi:hypothetical protein